MSSTPLHVRYAYTPLTSHAGQLPILHFWLSGTKVPVSLDTAVFHNTAVGAGQYLADDRTPGEAAGEYERVLANAERPEAHGSFTLNVPTAGGLAVAAIQVDVFDRKNDARRCEDVPRGREDAQGIWKLGSSALNMQTIATSALSRYQPASLVLNATSTWGKWEPVGQLELLLSPAPGLEGVRFDRGPGLQELAEESNRLTDRHLSYVVPFTEHPDPSLPNGRKFEVSEDTIKRQWTPRLQTRYKDLSLPVGFDDIHRSEEASSPAFLQYLVSLALVRNRLSDHQLATWIQDQRNSPDDVLPSTYHVLEFIADWLALLATGLEYKPDEICYGNVDFIREHIDGEPILTGGDDCEGLSGPPTLDMLYDFLDVADFGPHTARGQMAATCAELQSFLGYYAWGRWSIGVPSPEVSGTIFGGGARNTHVAPWGLPLAWFEAAAGHVYWTAYRKDFQAEAIPPFVAKLTYITAECTGMKASPILPMHLFGNQATRRDTDLVAAHASTRGPRLTAALEALYQYKGVDSDLLSDAYSRVVYNRTNLRACETIADVESKGPHTDSFYEYVTGFTTLYEYRRAPSTAARARVPFGFLLTNRDDKWGIDMGLFTNPQRWLDGSIKLKALPPMGPMLAENLASVTSLLSPVFPCQDVMPAAKLDRYIAAMWASKPIPYTLPAETPLSPFVCGDKQARRLEDGAYGPTTEIQSLVVYGPKETRAGTSLDRWRLAYETHACLYFSHYDWTRVVEGVADLGAMFASIPDVLRVEVGTQVLQPSVVRTEVRFVFNRDAGFGQGGATLPRRSIMEGGCHAPTPAAGPLSDSDTEDESPECYEGAHGYHAHCKNARDLVPCGNCGLLMCQAHRQVCDLPGSGLEGKFLCYSCGNPCYCLDLFVPGHEGCDCDPSDEHEDGDCPDCRDELGIAEDVVLPTPGGANIAAKKVDHVRNLIAHAYAPDAPWLTHDRHIVRSDTATYRAAVVDLSAIREKFRQPSLDESEDANPNTPWATDDDGHIAAEDSVTLERIERPAAIILVNVNDGSFRWPPKHTGVNTADWAVQRSGDRLELYEWSTAIGMMENAQLNVAPFYLPSVASRYLTERDLAEFTAFKERMQARAATYKAKTAIRSATGLKLKPAHATEHKAIIAKIAAVDAFIEARGPNGATTKKLAQTFNIPKKFFTTFFELNSAKYMRVPGAAMGPWMLRGSDAGPSMAPGTALLAPGGAKLGRAEYVRNLVTRAYVPGAPFIYVDPSVVRKVHGRATRAAIVDLRVIHPRFEQQPLDTGDDLPNPDTPWGRHEDGELDADDEVTYERIERPAILALISANDGSLTWPTLSTRLAVYEYDTLYTMMGSNQLDKAPFYLPKGTIADEAAFARFGQMIDSMKVVYDSNGGHLVPRFGLHILAKDAEAHYRILAVMTEVDSFILARGRLGARTKNLQREFQIPMARFTTFFAANPAKYTNVTKGPKVGGWRIRMTYTPVAPLPAPGAPPRALDMTDEEFGRYSGEVLVLSGLLKPGGPETRGRVMHSDFHAILELNWEWLVGSLRRRAHDGATPNAHNAIVTFLRGLVHCIEEGLSLELITPVAVDYAHILRMVLEHGFGDGPTETWTRKMVQPFLCIEPDYGLGALSYGRGLEPMLREYTSVYSRLRRVALKLEGDCVLRPPMGMDQYLARYNLLGVLLEKLDDGQSPVVFGQSLHSDPKYIALLEAEEWDGYVMTAARATTRYHNAYTDRRDISRASTETAHASPFVMMMRFVAIMAHRDMPGKIDIGYIIAQLESLRDSPAANAVFFDSSATIQYVQEQAGVIEGIVLADLEDDVHASRDRHGLERMIEFFQEVARSVARKFGPRENGPKMLRSDPFYALWDELMLQDAGAAGRQWAAIQESIGDDWRPFLRALMRSMRRVNDGPGMAGLFALFARLAAVPEWEYEYVLLAVEDNLLNPGSLHHIDAMPKATAVMFLQRRLESTSSAHRARSEPSVVRRLRGLVHIMHPDYAHYHLRSPMRVDEADAFAARIRNAPVAPWPRTLAARYDGLSMYDAHWDAYFQTAMLADAGPALDFLRRGIQAGLVDVDPTTVSTYELLHDSSDAGQAEKTDSIVSAIRFSVHRREDASWVAPGVAGKTPVYAMPEFLPGDLESLFGMFDPPANAAVTPEAAQLMYSTLAGPFNWFGFLHAIGAAASDPDRKETALRALGTILGVLEDRVGANGWGIIGPRVHYPRVLQMLDDRFMGGFYDPLHGWTRRMIAQMITVDGALYTAEDGTQSVHYQRLRLALDSGTGEHFLLAPGMPAADIEAKLAVWRQLPSEVPTGDIAVDDEAWNDWSFVALKLKRQYADVDWEAYFTGVFTKTPNNARRDEMVTVPVNGIIVADTIARRTEVVHRWAYSYQLAIAKAAVILLHQTTHALSAEQHDAFTRLIAAMVEPDSVPSHIHYVDYPDDANEYGYAAMGQRRRSVARALDLDAEME